MVSRQGGFEQILPALRALLARVLVNEMEHSRGEAASILRITPAAVTQYLKGQRAGPMVKKIRSSERLMLVVSNLARKADEDHTAEGAAMSITSLLDAAYQILAIMSGEGQEEKEVSTRTVKSGKKAEWISILKRRLQAEQLAAQRSMGLAIWSRNELARSLFRQIASDSLRHADIVSSLIAHLESDGGIIKLQVPSTKELEEIIKEEESAGEGSIEKLKQIGDPNVKLLIESIEADEEKHLKLLKGLLNLGGKS